MPEAIPTSGSHAVLLSGRPDDVEPRQLIALDLESGDAHLLGENSGLSFAHASPDGSAILFGGNESSRQDNFFIARVGDDGVTPATAVTNLGGDVGDRPLLGWTNDGRFVLLARISSVAEHGIDVIDARLGARLWSVDSDVTSFKMARFAPTGDWFSYSITGTGASSGIVRITSSGVEPVEIPQLVSGAVAFSPDGTRAAYMQMGSDGSRTFYRDLSAGGQATALDIDEPNISAAYPLAFLGDPDHLLVQVLDAAGVSSLRRLDLETGTATVVPQPDRTHVIAPAADASSLLGVESDDVQGQDALWLVDPTNEHAPATIETFVREPPSSTLFENLQLAGAVGSSHFFYVHRFGELTFVARASDGSAAVSVVSDPEDEGFLCLPQPGEPADVADRIAFVAGFGEALVMVDLSKPLAERVARLEPMHGGYLGCPVWNAERTALAFVERLEDRARSFLYTVEWPASGRPTAPVRVFESELVLSLIAYRP